MQNTFIFIDNINKVLDLMSSEKIRRGIILYSRTGNILAINQMIELPTASEMLADSYQRLQAKFKMEQAMTDASEQNLSLGEFVNHPSGTFELSKAEALNFTEKAKAFENYIYLVITRNGMEIFKPAIIQPVEKKIIETIN